MITPTNSDQRAYLWLTLTTLCWGFNAILGRLAVGEVSPMLLVTIRWVGVVLLLMAIARRSLANDWHVLRNHLWVFAFLGAVGFTGFNSLFYVAAHSTGAINIGIIQGSVPVFVMLGALFAYGTRVTALQITGVGITLIGVAVVASRGELERLATLDLVRGDVYMLLACLLYSVYTIALRRRPDVAALSLFCILAVAALITSIPFAVGEIMLGQAQWPTPKGWVIIGFICIFPSFVAQLAFINGVSLIGPGRAGVFINLVPIFAAVLAVLILREPFRGFHAISLVLVLAGIALSELGKPVEKNP